MAPDIEYNGHVLTPATRLRSKARGWTLEVHIAAANRSTGLRRCRAPNTYATEAEAIVHCLEFGRRIVDGKLRPRPKRDGSR
ncbi:MAG: hypothetical protein HY560_05815 [Gemmatimonadetes bacterium]|nr:hypothetical protein [Gemmatimonadota bacterium]